MAPENLPRILCVDDDSNLLEGLVRSLRGHFRVETATDAIVALESLTTVEPYSVVVSDQRMPRMNGVAFLANIRASAPTTVRVLLTGQADMESAIAAVNEGNIFRFLTKPCSTAVLLKTLSACMEQHRLIVAEKVLLEQTLRGSIKALIDIMSLANPMAFGRATRVRRSVEQLLGHFDICERWPVEVAAMLSQIGYVTLPPATLEKLHGVGVLKPAEQEMLDRMPLFIDQCLSNIPRIEPVREILRLYPRHFGGTASDSNATAGSEIPWGARALRIALDFDSLQSEEPPATYPFAIMRGRIGCYDPAILEAFAKLHGESQTVQMVELQIRDLTVGMIFGQDLKSAAGVLLVARGQEVTPGLLERLRNVPADMADRRSVRMIAPSAAAYPVLAGAMH
ncbi:MAG TPA: HD domain-containing phosphohydrolase [Candidatus Acidoferrales bacterium]